MSIDCRPVSRNIKSFSCAWPGRSHSHMLLRELFQSFFSLRLVRETLARSFLWMILGAMGHIDSMSQKPWLAQSMTWPTQSVWPEIVKELDGWLLKINSDVWSPYAEEHEIPHKRPASVKDFAFPQTTSTPKHTKPSNMSHLVAEIGTGWHRSSIWLGETNPTKKMPSVCISHHTGMFPVAQERHKLDVSASGLGVSPMTYCNFRYFAFDVVQSQINSLQTQNRFKFMDDNGVRDKT
jgi:hypothetical protein